MVVLIKKFTPIFQKIFTIKILKKSHKIIKSPLTIKSIKPLNLTTTPPYLGSRSKTRPLTHSLKIPQNPHLHTNTIAIGHQYQRLSFSPL